MIALRVTAQGASGFGRTWPCSLGKGGISNDKREGDGTTPCGVLTVAACLYRSDRIARPAPWARSIGPRDLWCDDPDHALYNQFTRSPLAASHERLRRSDPLYDIVLITDYNWPAATPGKGSAIFIHRWRKARHPTEGCIAFHMGDLIQLAGLLIPGSKIAIS